MKVLSTDISHIVDFNDAIKVISLKHSMYVTRDNGESIVKTSYRQYVSKPKWKYVGSIQNISICMSLSVRILVYSPTDTSDFNLFLTISGNFGEQDHIVQTHHPIEINLSIFVLTKWTEFFTLDGYSLTSGLKPSQWIKTDYMPDWNSTLYRDSVHMW